MEWYTMVLWRYAEFDGRSQRKEYWMYVLISLFVYLMFYVGGIVMVVRGRNLGALLIILAIVYALATLVPSLAVSVRRLHDTNKSGWWLLLGLIPLVNLALIILMAIDGDPGPNQYGPNPKQFVQPAAIV